MLEDRIEATAGRAAIQTLEEGSAMIQPAVPLICTVAFPFTTACRIPYRQYFYLHH